MSNERMSMIQTAGVMQQISGALSYYKQLEEATQDASRQQYFAGVCDGITNTMLIIDEHVSQGEESDET